MLRKLSEDIHAVVDLNVVLMIGIAFAGLMVLAYIIWTLYDLMVPTVPVAGTHSTSYFNKFNSTKNITTGFDDAVNLLLIAITVFILAIAIAALLMLRGRQ